MKPLTVRSESGRIYPSWDALVEAEANGYVTVALLKGKERIFVQVFGPFPSKREATNAGVRLRTKHKRQVESLDHNPAELLAVSVRPCWMEV